MGCEFNEDETIVKFRIKHERNCKRERRPELKSERSGGFGTSTLFFLKCPECERESARFSYGAV
jgi:hypothetical protein